MSKIVVGMSGGVDSSAAALRLIENGHDVVGVTLLLSDNEDSYSAAEDARRVCGQLGIEHHAPNYCDIFTHSIKDYFCGEYIAGRTPNPCVMCNKKIKFGVMLDYAQSIGCDYIATGHYTDVGQYKGRSCIKKVSSPKDQSYVLWMLSSEQIARAMFPIGNSDKSRLRDEVERAGLCVAHKPDSQDICFIPDRDYVKFIRNATGISPESGLFVDREGNVLGRHNGCINYTIGQRKGLGGGFSCPMFVIGIDAERNRVVLGREEEQYTNRCVCTQINMIADLAVGDTITADVKIRYQAKPTQANITRTAEDRLLMEFSQPQRAITPGQSAVIYDEMFVIGGGIISSAE